MCIIRAIPGTAGEGGKELLGGEGETRAAYGLRNIEVYIKKMLLGFLPPLPLYFDHAF